MPSQSRTDAGILRCAPGVTTGGARYDCGELQKKTRLRDVSRMFGDREGRKRRIGGGETVAGGQAEVFILNFQMMDFQA